MKTDNTTSTTAVLLRISVLLFALFGTAGKAQAESFYVAYEWFNGKNLVKSWATGNYDLPLNTKDGIENLIYDIEQKRGIDKVVITYLKILEDESTEKEEIDINDVVI